MAEQENKKFVKLAHLCPRSGTEAEWTGGSKEKTTLLKGEMAISHKSQRDYSYPLEQNSVDKNLSIIKFGNGIDEWSKLQTYEENVYDKEGNFIGTEYKNDSSVFYSGRGAGILPATNDNVNDNAPLGGMKLLTPELEKSLTLDENGHLSFWKYDENGKRLHTSINVDVITTGQLNITTPIQQDISFGNEVVLRSEAKEGLGEEYQYSGFVVAKYNGYAAPTQGGDIVGNDTGLIVDQDGTWRIGNRSRIAYYETNEEGEQILKERGDIWVPQHNLVKSPLDKPTVSSLKQYDIPYFPILMTGKDELIEWKPNTLHLKFGEREYDYNPFDTESNNDENKVYSVAEDLIQKIVVSTYNLETNEPVSEAQEYTVQDGAINLRLPVATPTSIDYWNGKISSLQVTVGGNANLNNNNEVNKTINFTDTEVVVDEMGNITLPIVKWPTIMFDNNNVGDGNGNYNILTKYPVTEIALNTALTLDNSQQTEEGAQKYVLSHKKITTEEIAGPTITKPFEDWEGDFDTISEIEVDGEGHLISYKESKYNIKDLIDKINYLETQLKKAGIITS
jgi:hypothetical protein